MDCSKSAELYEQSAEQLAEEERRRAEFKKINSEFHRDKENRINFDNTVDYNDQNNERATHFVESQNRMQSQEQRDKKYHDQKNYNKHNNINDQNFNTNNNEYLRSSTNTYQADVRQRNHLVNDGSGKSVQSNNNHIYTKLQRGSNKLYEQERNNLNFVNNDQDDEYNTFDQNGQKNDENTARLSKGQTFRRNNVNVPIQKNTPSYTETTTFRTSTSSPVKELQQLAESASFTSRQNMRYNKGYNSNQFITYYNNKINTQDSSIKSPEEENRNQPTRKTAIPSFPGPTFTPIFKPRIIPTTPQSVTNPKSFSNANNYKQSTDEGRTFSTPLAYVTSSSNSQNFYQRNTGNSNYYSTDYYTNSPSTKNSFDRTTASSIPKQNHNSSNVNNNVHKQNASFFNQAKNRDISNDQRDKVIVHSHNQNELSIATTDYKNDRERTNNNNQRITAKTPVRNSKGNFQNLISATTEKPARNAQKNYNVSNHNYQTTRSSVVRPYVPFTKNYAYSSGTSTTTQKPLVYTATVPTYNTNINRNNNQLKNKPYTTSVLSSYSSVTTSNRATYLPKKTTTPFIHTTARSILDNRPENEKEHALNMLISLTGLEGAVPSSVKEGNRPGLNIPSSSGPSALHSLALYFATAANESNNVLNNNTQYPNNNVSTIVSSENKTRAELPTSILTQHTINSYTELFNLNNALENNFTNFDENGEEIIGEDTSDLELQQSAGPLNGAKKSNGTKLRELAQVFTQALSAYLQDPETFKRVLTEIRPTEPSKSSEAIDATTNYPTTTEEYPSVTKEKGEVLDFSDDINAARKRQPNKVYSVNTPRPYTSTTVYHSTDAITEEQYSKSTPNPQNYDQGNSFQKEKPNDFAYSVNNAFNEDTSNKKGQLVNDYDSYFPSSSNSIKYNNTQPYGQYVKPYDATPISENYVASSTPATYSETESFVPVNNQLNDKIRGNESPLTYEFVKNFATTTLYNSDTGDANTVTSTPEQNIESTTSEPFRIQFFGTTQTSKDESLATANSFYSNYGKNKNNLIDELTHEQLNKHWTSSPSVTHLWESTVFVDPQHINRGLIDGKVNPDFAIQSNVANSSTIFTRDNVLSRGTVVSPQDLNTNNSTKLQWTLNNDDSPTAFTLLPSIYAEEQSVTATPSYSTYTATTMKAQIKPKSNEGSRKTLPQLQSTSKIYNVTENELIKAQQIFGKLNESSSSTLMNVMKQADNNVTVRQLVLLLINHCNGPMNKTMEEEKEHLLNALLRLPVNAFSSHESREIIAGINKISLPIGSSEKYPTTVSPVPIVTTYRSRKERRYKSTTEKPSTSRRKTEEFSTAESKNSVLIQGATVSDNRALELLRSLYSIAAKWG